MDKMKEDYRDSALNSVKTDLVLRKISNVESITPSDEDIDQEIERMAKQYNQEVDKFKASLQEREMEIVKNEVITHKTVDFLVQNAVTAA
jgi:trigger factor